MLTGLSSVWPHLFLGPDFIKTHSNHPDILTDFLHRHLTLASSLPQDLCKSFLSWNSPSVIFFFQSIHSSGTCPKLHPFLSLLKQAPLVCDHWIQVGHLQKTLFFKKNACTLLLCGGSLLQTFKTFSSFVSVLGAILLN